VVHTAMLAGLSYSRLADADFAHPTMAEGLSSLFSSVPPRAMHSAETMDSVFKLPGGNGVYEIPLGAVTSLDTANLFAAGRTADGDQMAGASLRVMATAFATGQACGVCAARYPHKADSLIAEIQTALREQGALIDGDDLPDPVTLQYT
jgi:hypothetical protein